MQTELGLHPTPKRWRGASGRKCMEPLYGTSSYFTYVGSLSWRYLWHFSKHSHPIRRRSVCCVSQCVVLTVSCRNWVRVLLTCLHYHKYSVCLLQKNYKHAKIIEHRGVMEQC